MISLDASVSRLTSPSATTLRPRRGRAGVGGGFTLCNTRVDRPLVGAGNQRARTLPGAVAADQLHAMPLPKGPVPLQQHSSVRRVHDVLALSRERLAKRDPDIVKSQVAVSEIAAPTGDERTRATWIAERLAAIAGLDVRVDRAGNVIARRRSPMRADERPVVVCAHLDTVFPRETPLRVKREGSRLVGPGI